MVDGPRAALVVASTLRTTCRPLLVHGAGHLFRVPARALRTHGQPRRAAGALLPADRGHARSLVRTPVAARLARSTLCRRLPAQRHGHPDATAPRRQDRKSVV